MRKNEQKKFIISGYIGFQNFGDDAILQVLIDDIYKCTPNAEITALSDNPKLTQTQYSIKSIHRFNLGSIIKEMSQCNYLISSGGSLLQDITSLQSLIYYLGIIAVAILFKVKILLYAQGIGPIKSKTGKFLTKIILKKADMITVRDKESQDFLIKMDINSTLTADPVWRLENKKIEMNTKNDRITLGIQLRKWHCFNEPEINNLAQAINENFDPDNTVITVLPLQNSQDVEISNLFLNKLKSINNLFNIEIKEHLSINEIVSIISSLDYFISMRFHANLIAIKYGIPTIAVSYDPKVEILAKDTGIPYIKVRNTDKKNFSENIQKLIQNKSNYINSLENYSKLKQETSRQSLHLLSKMIME